MSFRIVRSPEYFQYHVFDTAHALKFGLEKACILENISKLESAESPKIEVLFSYIPKDRLFQLIRELIEAGHLKEVNHE